MQETAYSQAEVRNDNINGSFKNISRIFFQRYITNCLYFNAAPEHTGPVFGLLSTFLRLLRANKLYLRSEMRLKIPKSQKKTSEDHS